MSEVISQDEVQARRIAKPIDLERVCVHRVHLPTMDEVIPGLVRGTVGILDCGNRRTAFESSLAVAVSAAAGRDVFGLWPAAGKITPCSVLLVGLDDLPIAYSRRMQGVCETLADGEVEAVVQNLKIIPHYGLGFEIGPNATTGDDLLKSWAAIHKPRLIIINTINKAVPGHDLRNPADFNHIDGRMEAICRDTGAAVLLSHRVDLRWDPKTPGHDNALWFWNGHTWTQLGRVEEPA